MLLSPFSSLLGEAETVVTIYKHNIDIIINTHTVPTVIGGGPSLFLKRYTYKAVGGCSLMSYPGPKNKIMKLAAP